MGVYFNGKTYIKPGAYSAVDVSGMYPSNSAANKTIILIGTADGGAPKTILYFNTPEEAAEILLGGDLLTAARLAWGPSPSVNGAGKIGFIRVNNATKAETTIKGTGNVDAIKLEAKNYTTRTYKYKLGAGSNGGVIVTLTDGVVTEISPEITFNNASIVNWINNNSNIVTATKLSDALVSATPDYVNFTTQGTNPAATTQDWQNAIDLLGTIGLNEMIGVVALTSDETIHAYLNAHILAKSANKRERRAFYGAGLNETTVEQLKTRAKNLNSHRAVLVAPGVKHTIDGVVTTLPAYFTAAMVAGMWAGAPDDLPLTYKYISCLGLEKIYTDTEIEDLISNGILTLEDDGNGYRIVQAITTSSDSNITYKELSVSTLADRMSVELRKYLEERFIGQKPALTTPDSVASAVITKLNEFVDNGWLVGSDKIPPYRNIKVRKNADVYYVDWEGSPAIPNNFILITSHFKLI